MKKNILIIGLAIFVILGFLFIVNRINKPEALVALVIDDWGYSQNNLKLLFEIDRPVTVSILPNLPYSRRIAMEARKKSEAYDIILHLPLESKGDIAAEKNTIRASMGEKTILSIFEDDIESIPGIIGVSNHQGSKATADERVMGLVLGELKKRDLFFLDSLTTSHSVCGDIAHNIGLSYIKRDVFLDITDQTDMQHFEDYIRKQIRELAEVALRHGTAIGVGHSKTTTLKVIKDSIPEMERQGIRIVPLKELIR